MSTQHFILIPNIWYAYTNFMYMYNTFFNGSTPFVHMQYGCVRVLVQNTFLHVKRGFCMRIIFGTHTK